MARTLLRRLAIAIPMLIVVSMVMFLLMSLVPGDAAQTILGENATPQAVDALRDQLGLNLPLYEQYWNWLIHAVQGDLGQSIYSAQSVVELLNSRLPVTVSLVGLSTVTIAVVGCGLGLLSAFRGGWLGKVIDAVSLVGLAVPSFAIAVLLVWIFAVVIPIFPATGYDSSSFGTWITSMILPVGALSLAGITMVAKQMRDSALDALSKDYIRVLRASGISERSILFRHVLKNAAIPSTTVIALGTIASLTATVFVENVFVLPGLGTIATQSTLKHDLPVLVGLGVYFAVIVIAINLTVDIAYGILNPKVRSS